MSSIGQIVSRFAFLMARRQMIFYISAPSQPIFHPKKVLGITIHSMQQKCLPSNSIIKLYKSTEANEENLDEKPTRRFFTQEEDEKLRRHVTSHGKSKESLKEIADVLERTLKSVQNRCSRLALTDKDNSDKKNLARMELC